MQVLLFSIVAICIAGSRSQEIALGTGYLRAHANDSLASESAINAQIIDLPPAGLIGVVNSESSTSSTGSTTTTLASKKGGDDDDDSSPETEDKDKSTTYNREHAATISIDVHNILDLFKEHLHQTEERLLAAIQHSSPSNSVPVPKSYRTADR